MIGLACGCGQQTRYGSVLCGACEAALSDRPEMATYRDLCTCFEQRLHAAFVLREMSRGLVRKEVNSSE